MMINQTHRFLSQYLSEVTVKTFLKLLTHEKKGRETNRSYFNEYFGRNKDVWDVDITKGRKLKSKHLRREVKSPQEAHVESSWMMNSRKTRK